MKQRGRVLQDASTGKGLISSDGNQYEFEIAGVWKSDSAPKVDMVVEIELDSAGKISAAYAVSESDLAKEQAEKAMQAAKEKGAALYGELSARLGKPVLGALAGVAVSWFFLNLITIQLTASSSTGITFWQLLGIVNAGETLGMSMNGNLDKGIYGLFAIIALAGPFISQFWKDPKAHLGHCLPFVLMLTIGVKIYLAIHGAAQESQAQLQALGGNPFAGYAQEMMGNMVKEVLKAIHIGVGGYVAVACSAFLAFVGMKKFLAAKA